MNLDALQRGGAPTPGVPLLIAEWPAADEYGDEANHILVALYESGSGICLRSLYVFRRDPYREEWDHVPIPGVAAIAFERWADSLGYQET